MHLIGDIGGTNIRLGLLDKGRIHSTTYLLAADFPDLRNAITYYLSTQPEAKVSRAALAVASPIISDQVKTVHSHLNFSICQLKSELRLAELQVVNDFEAAALAVPGLGMGDLMRIGPNEPLSNKPKLLVGPGTSFGAATIVPVAEKWIVLPSEAMELPMGLSQHKDIIAYVHDRFGSFRIGHFLSGDGFAQIHEAVRVARHRLEPAEVPIVAPEVMAAAKAGDPVAKDAAAVFVQVLGHVAGSYAMTPMAMGGVYLTGGVTDAIRSAGLLDAGLFRQAFERQGVKGIESRTRLLETIATHAVTASDLGMLGLRTLLKPAHAAAGFRSTPKAAIASPL